MLVEAFRRASASEHDVTGIPARPAVTVLLNALRCGVEFDALRRALPALDSAQLLHAHEYLTHRLAHTRRAWSQVAADTTVAGESCAQVATEAARLMPVPVHRIATLRFTLDEPATIEQAVRSVAAEVHRVTGAAGNIERKLATRPAGATSGLRLGRSLHDGSEPGVWTHPYFLPDRVGQLSPTRVRDLLAEVPDDDA